MANFCTVACIQTTSGPDMTANCGSVETMVKQAAQAGAQLIALPENVFLMRASDADKIPLLAEHEHPGVQLCQRLALDLGVWIIIGSVMVPSGTHCHAGNPKMYNRSILIDSLGKIAARYNKIHLFDAMINDGVRYQESARVERGEHMSVTSTPWGMLGMAICYDVRFPHLHREMAQAGATILSIPAAFAEYTGRAHWHVMVRARAIETGCFVLAPGQCGVHPGGRRTYGHSLIIGPWGEILAEGSAETPEIIYAKLDLDHVRDVRGRLPSLYHDRAYAPPPDYMI